MALNPANSDRLEQVTRELVDGYIPWPQGDRLPMKRRDGVFVTGSMALADAWEHSAGRGPVKIRIEGGEIVTFQTVDDMLRAGWVVD